jgi:dolichyl-phosphate beta-glucosyltransferase
VSSTVSHTESSTMNNTMGQKTLTLLIPCYNEEARLRLDEFKKAANQLTEFKIFYVFANDGSKDQTASKITKYISDQQLDSNWFLFNNPQNTGKANVLYNAFQWSLKNTPSTDWYGYWDADLATPLFEIPKMLQYQNIFYPNHEAI